jgi:hypothetical protein
MKICLTPTLSQSASKPHSLKLRGAMMLGALRPKRGDVLRPNGLVIDPETLIENAQPLRYASRFVLLSDLRARGRAFRQMRVI